MTKRDGDKWVGVTALGFLGILGLSIGSNFIPNVKQYGNFIMIIIAIFVILFIIGQIQMRRVHKLQCKRGEHDPDELRICRDCHKHLEGSEDLIDAHNRKIDRNLSTNKGFLKIIVPTIAMIIGLVIFSYWMVISSHADLINGINSINGTDPKACLILVEQQGLQKGMNAFMFGSHVIKATQNKWNELDCIHKPIMDDLNKTCPIGVVPTLQGMKGYLCYPDEEVVK